MDCEYGADLVSRSPWYQQWTKINGLNHYLAINVTRRLQLQLRTKRKGFVALRWKDKWDNNVCPEIWKKQEGTTSSKQTYSIKNPKLTQIFRLAFFTGFAVKIKKDRKHEQSRPQTGLFKPTMYLVDFFFIGSDTWAS